MSNENCLNGIQCPNCGALEPFYITATCNVKVYDDGTEDAFDFCWDNNSLIQCPSCGHLKKVMDFIRKQNNEDSHEQTETGETRGT